MGALSVDIDIDVVHPREIYHQAVVTHRLARPAMATTAYGNQQIALTRKGGRIGNVQAILLVVFLFGP